MTQRERDSSSASKSGKSNPVVHQVTSAPEPLYVDQKRRMRRYLIQMTVRVVCFIAAFVAWQLNANMYVVLGFVAAAAVLPYFAVVGVNAGRAQDSGRVMNTVTADPQHRITGTTEQDDSHTNDY